MRIHDIHSEPVQENRTVLQMRPREEPKRSIEDASRRRRPSAFDRGGVAGSGIPNPRFPQQDRHRCGQKSDPVPIMNQPPGDSLRILVQIPVKLRSPGDQANMKKNRQQAEGSQLLQKGRKTGPVLNTDDCQRDKADPPESDSSSRFRIKSGSERTSQEAALSHKPSGRIVGPALPDTDPP